MGKETEAKLVAAIFRRPTVNGWEYGLMFLESLWIQFVELVATSQASGSKWTAWSNLLSTCVGAGPAPATAMVGWWQKNREEHQEGPRNQPGVLGLPVS